MTVQPQPHQEAGVLDRQLIAARTVVEDPRRVDLSARADATRSIYDGNFFFFRIYKLFIYLYWFGVYTKMIVQMYMKHNIMIACTIIC